MVCSLMKRVRDRGTSEGQYLDRALHEASSRRSDFFAILAPKVGYS